jgi:hypothetical protein
LGGVTQAGCRQDRGRSSEAPRPIFGRSGLARMPASVPIELPCQSGHLRDGQLRCTGGRCRDAESWPPNVANKKRALRQSRSAQSPATAPKHRVAGESRSFSRWRQVRKAVEPSVCRIKPPWSNMAHQWMGLSHQVPNRLMGHGKDCPRITFHRLRTCQTVQDTTLLEGKPGRTPRPTCHGCRNLVSFVKSHWVAAYKGRSAQQIPGKCCRRSQHLVAGAASVRCDMTSRTGRGSPGLW